MAKSFNKSSTKYTFKQCFEDFGTVMGSIRQKNFKRVYLLMGDEPYFIDRISDTLANNILKEDEQAFNQNILYGKDCNGTELVELCRSYPMMSTHNVVILKDAQQMKDLDTLVHYFTSPLDSTILVICHKDGNLDKRSSLFKKIKDYGLVFESIAPRDYEIGIWIKEYYKNNNYSIDDKAMFMLTEHLGASMSKIVNESSKMFVRIAGRVKTITPNEIEENIGISKEYNIFELNKALSERNLTRALSIVKYFEQNPKNNPLVVTISMMFTHFQRIFTLGIMEWQYKKKGQMLPSDFELAKTLKLPNAYFIKEYKMAVKNFPTSKSFIILGLIREYDMKSKGVDGGFSDNGELLKELIFKIFTC
ncbi:MAG: DNA polymerase III subunit delta [Rikenellaceae bacterium]